MRICPKCGYIDRSHWRQNRWRTNVDFIHTFEFELLNPVILRSLKDGHEVVCDEYYAYRFGNKKCSIVERILKIDYEQGGLSAFHIPREKAPYMDPFERRLRRFIGISHSKRESSIHGSF